MVGIVADRMRAPSPSPRGALNKHAFGTDTSVREVADSQPDFTPSAGENTMIMFILLVPAVVLWLVLGMDRLERWAVEGTDDQT
jgi:hypothetical protein